MKRLVTGFSRVLVLATVCVSSASAQAPVQTFFVPNPEVQVRTWAGSMTVLPENDEIHSVISITITADSTIIYYDQWENGFDTTIESPDNLYSGANLGGTQIWGDGDTSNGAPPAGSCCVDDLLDQGDVLILESDVPVPAGVRDSNNLFFDGSDKFAATDLLAVTRGAWPSTGVEAQLGGAVEVFSTDKWGSSYEIPLGEDMGISAFEFVGLSIMAQEDGTVVSVDTDADGTDDLSQVLDQGESLLVSAVGATDLDLGTTVTSSSDVQVTLLTSNEVTTYEGRWYSMLPVADWTDLYFNPVGRTDAVIDLEVFLYNPNAFTITVAFEELGSCRDIDVLPGAFTEVTLIDALPSVSASRLSTSGSLTNPGLDCGGGAITGGSFFAVGTMERSVQIHDWGHTLIPEASLTPSAVVGWAPGSTDLVQNASPVWVTAVEPPGGTLIYVDYDGDPTTGPSVDPAGNRYDIDIAATSLEAYRIFDPDNDQTGMRIYTANGTRLTAAWGQDPEFSGSGEPTQLDMGTTVLPFSSLAAFKESSILDSNGNGGLDPGEGVFYTIRVRNTGVVPITDIDLIDTPDPNTTYLAGTTEIDGVPVPDDGSGTPFPLDDDPVATGYPLVVSPDNLDPSEEIVITFIATVNSPLPMGVTEIVNNVQVSSDSEIFIDSESDPIPQGEMSILKTSNAPAAGVAAGAVLTYTVVVSNDSTGRTLTEIQLDDLLPAGVTYVAESTVVTGPTGIAGTYRDDFSAALYNGNTGSVDWSDELWVETGDDGLPGSGNIDIVGGELHFQGDETNTTIERELDLSGADTANFSFDWRCAGDMEATDFIAMEVSGNGGGSWTTLTTLFGGSDICPEPADANSGTESEDITAFIAANTRIRWRFSINVASENFFVDSVTVTATHSSESKDNAPGGFTDLDDGDPPSLVNIADDFVLDVGESLTATFDVLVDTPVDGSITRLLNVAQARSAELPDPIESSVSDPVIRGAIGDLVWLDADGDGIEDIGEPGLANVEVRLFDAGPDGMVGGGDDVLISTQLTGLDGQYRFDNVPPGDFYVDVTDATLPAGLTISPGNSDPSAIKTITGAEEFFDADFGYSNADPLTAILGDYVWNDIDRDGVQDPGELGLGGVTLELVDVSTGLTVAGPVTTGPDGRYLFIGVPPGEYEVRVTDTGGILGGFTPTMGPQSEGSFTSLPVTVLAGDVVDDLDFGFAPGSCLPRLDFNVDASGDAIVPGQTLDSEWSAWGLNLSFTVNAPSTGPLMAFSSTSPTGADFDLGTPNQTCTPPGLGVGVDGEFGQPGENCLPRGNLLIISEDGDASDPDDAGDGGTVIFDFDADVEIEAVEFIDAENNLDSVELFDSGANSIFFSNLSAPGDNSFENLPVDTAGARQMVITFPASGSVSGVDFCLGSIRDKLWFDLDNNSLFDLLGADGAPGTGDEEPGVPGVSVNLLDDTGAVIATTFTDADGNFGFDGLEDGDYTIEITDTAGVLQGFGGTTAPALAGQLAATITGGVDVVGINFGYNRPATIGDTVWTDANGNGIQDPGEAGIEGVTVELWLDADGDALFDSTVDTLVSSTMTGPGGMYLFPGLNTSIYFVSVDDAQPALTGYTPTTSDTQTGGNASGTQIGALLILGGQTFLSADFGYMNSALADISGTVFEDQDRDGVEDGGEPGFQNATIDLLDSSGNVIATTVTDASGNYSFPDLPPGDYSVQVTDVNGVLVGYSLTSGLDTINVTLGATDVTDIDFGYARDPGSGSIGDTVWLDQNLDGVRSGAEAGISGVEVTLYLDDGDGIFNAGTDTPLSVMITDANGEYRFPGLGAGNYFVDVTEATLPQPDSDLVETTSEPSALIPLSDSETYIDADFGYAPAVGTAVVGDRVWSDADGDGLQDPGEVGIPGVTIQVFGGVCTPCTTVTGADGAWLISGLAPGDYTVTFDTAPPGYNPLPTNLDPDDSYNVTLVAGDLFTHLDFGFDGAPVGSVGTFLWFDDNGDGDVDAGEIGVEDVTVNLIRDVNGNGTIDAGEPVIATVRTDPDGAYVFTGLPLSDGGDGDLGDADYLIDVTDIEGHLDATNLSVGTPDTDNNSQADPYAVALTAGTPDNILADFGYAPSQGVGAIGSQVWRDLDLDGVFEPLGDDGVAGTPDDEPGIQGVTIQLWLDDGDGTYEPFSGDDNLLRSIPSDANGEYEFDALPANRYWVTVTDTFGVVAGFIRTPGGTPFGCPGADDLSKEDPCEVVLTTGSPTDLTVDFGYAADPMGPVMTISGTVFEDEDRSGTYEQPAEPEVAGALVSLFRDLDGDGQLDPGEPLIGTTTSGASGDGADDYFFNNLPPGDYLVAVDPAGTAVDNYIQTTQAGTLGIEPVTLVATDIADRDFGYWSGGIVTTPVTLVGFSAEGGAGSVTFRWTTATEVGNVGFDLWSVGEAGMTRLNDELIRSALGDAFEPQTYTFEASGVTGKSFLLEDRDLFGNSRYHGPFALGESKGRAQIERRPIDWSSVRAKHAERAESRTAARIAASARYSVQGPPVTLRVSEEGIYRVTYEQLLAIGANYAGVPEGDLWLESQGVAVPIRVDSAGQGQFGPGAFFEFVGKPVDSLYTHENIYSLRLQSGGPRVLDAAGRTRPGTSMPSHYIETAEVEFERRYHFAAPSDDPWYDTALLATSDPVEATFGFDLDGWVEGAAPVQMRVDMWGVTNFPSAPDHHVVVDVNDLELADEWFDGLVDQPVEFEVPASALDESGNLLRLSLPHDTGAAYDLVHYDGLVVSYPREFRATGGSLAFDYGRSRGFLVDGLPSNEVVVYQVTAEHVWFGTSVQVGGVPGDYSASFSLRQRLAGRHYVSTVESLLAPVVELAPEPTDLTGAAADLLVIAHADFVEGIEPLAQARRNQGLSVKVADVADVYRQFGDGIVDPQAIKAYLAYAFDEMDTRFALLVGGDSYDYFDYTGSGSMSFVPTMYARTDEIVHFAPVDSLYVDFDSDGLVEMAIGRLPVRTVDELARVVEKTLDYDGIGYGATALLAADGVDAPTAFSFTDASEAMRSQLPASWLVDTAYIDELGVDTARQSILDGIESGVALTSYFGHSGPTVWSFSDLFDTADAVGLENFGRPTVVAQWGCWNTYHVAPGFDTLGHVLMLGDDQGAAAVLGAATLTEAFSEKRLGTELFARIGQPGVPIGEAILEAKRALGQREPDLLDVLWGWTLLGDPTLIVQP